MKKDDRLRITVSTVPNGYMMDLSSPQIHQGYLYYRIEDLIKGMIYHAGLKEIEPEEKAYITRVLKSFSKWNDVKELTDKLFKMEELLRLEKESTHSLQETVKQKKARIAKLTADNAVIRQKLKKYEDKEKQARKEEREKAKADKQVKECDTISKEKKKKSSKSKVRSPKPGKKRQS